MKYYLIPLVLLIHYKFGTSSLNKYRDQNENSSFKYTITLPERKINPLSGAFSGAKIPAAVSGIKMIPDCPDITLKRISNKIMANPGNYMSGKIF